MEDKHKIKLQGKDFVLYEGLLNEFHTKKGRSIITEVACVEPFIVKATVTTDEGRIFTGLGDATEDNVNRMIAKHRFRMAETRAKARALRDAYNIGMCSFEELGGEEEPETPIKVNELVAEVPLKCNECEAKVTLAEKNYSMKFFGNVYCRECQVLAKEKKKWRSDKLFY